jgi:NADH-quinone oxidoreductase subunit M
MAQHVLSILVLVPLLGIAAVLCAPARLARQVTMGVALLALVLAMWAGVQSQRSLLPALQETYERPGGLLEDAIARRVDDPEVQAAFAAALRGPPLPYEAAEGEALAARLAGVADAAASVRHLREAEAEPERLTAATEELRAARRESERLAAALQATRDEVDDMRRAAYGPSRELYTLVEHVPWVPSAGIHWSLAVDGLSLALILLTALLTLLCVLADRPPTDPGRLRAHHAAFLLQEGALLGLFVAQDLVLLYAFWVLALLPVVLLVAGQAPAPGARPDGGTGGGLARTDPHGLAALRVLAPALLSALAILAGGALLAVSAGERPTFSLLALCDRARAGLLDSGAQGLAFACLALGCAARMPLVPLHGWLSETQRRLPPAMDALLQGAAVKAGAYGLLRLAWPLCPEVVTQPTVILLVALLGLGHLVYGASVALGREDLRARVTAANVGAGGLVLLGLASLTPAGWSGAGLHVVSHGVAATGALLALGLASQRPGPQPGLPAGAAPFLVALGGLPGLCLFVPTLLVLLGAWSSPRIPHGLTGLSLLAVLAGGLWILTTLRTRGRDHPASPAELTPHEARALVPLLVLALALGLYPRLALDTLAPALEGALPVRGSP